MLGRYLKEDHRPVVLERTLEQPRSELRQVVETRPPEAERLHGLGEMVAARLLPIGVLIEGERVHVELACEVRSDRHWRHGKVIGDEAKEAQRAQLQREAEAVRVAAPSSNEREVIQRQPVVHREVDLEQFVGEMRQSGAFILGEEASRHSPPSIAHSAAPRVHRSVLREHLGCTEIATRSARTSSPPIAAALALAPAPASTRSSSPPRWPSSLASTSAAELELAAAVAELAVAELAGADQVGQDLEPAAALMSAATSAARSLAPIKVG